MRTAIWSVTIIDTMYEDEAPEDTVEVINDALIAQDRDSYTATHAVLIGTKDTSDD